MIFLAYPPERRGNVNNRYGQNGFLEVKSNGMVCSRTPLL